MDSLWWIVLFPLTLFGLGCMVSIFSQDIRQKVMDTYMARRYRGITAFNAKLDEKIALIRRLQNPVAAIGYISGNILLTLILISLTLFFGISMVLEAQILLSVLGFFLFWYVSIVFAAVHVEIAFQVSHGEAAVESLEQKRRTNS